MKKMLETFNREFDHYFHKSIIIVFTRWAYDFRSEDIREADGISYEFRTQEFNSILKKTLRCSSEEHSFPCVFIDNKYSNKDSFKKYKPSEYEFAEFVENLDVIKKLVWPEIFNTSCPRNRNNRFSYSTVILKNSIQSIKNFLKNNQETLSTMKSIHTELEKHITGCKISNTVGNSISIAAVPMLFFPVTLIPGIVLLAVGTATSATSSIIKFIGENNNFKKIKTLHEKSLNTHKEINELFKKMAVIPEKSWRYIIKEYLKDEDLGGFLESIVKIYFKDENAEAKDLAAINGARFLIYLPNQVAAGLEVGFVAGQVGMLATRLVTQITGVLAAGLSTFDIIHTWTKKEITLEKIKEDIQKLEKSNEAIREIVSKKKL